MSIKFKASNVEDNQSKQVSYNDPYKQYTKFKLEDLNIGGVYSGKPSVHLYENEGETNKGKPITWDTLRIRIADTNKREMLVAYANVPKADDDGLIKNIYRNNSFYRNIFNVIISTLGMEDENNIFDDAGMPINRIDEIDLDDVIDFLNSQELVHLTVKPGASMKYPSFVLDL